MPRYQNEIDIGNRAAQHCGAELMDPTLGFAEDKKTAAQIGPVYDKVRQAELERNVWVFACKRAMLRPIDSNTMLLVPSLWVQSTTYFRGSIVTDDEGVPWVSLIPNNVGVQPGQLPVQSAWAPYFGPMSVSLYDSTQSYASGELVYTTAGDGTFNVWSSLLTGNAVHPAIPTQWSTSTVYYKNQVVQEFPAWSSLTTYTKGQGVKYTDGNVYASLTDANLNNVPPSSGNSWALMPVLTLVTQPVPANPAAPFVAMSPPTASPIYEWSQGQGYSKGNFVVFNGAIYLSLVNSNTGNFPNASGSTSWVTVTNGTLYMSLIDFNAGNDPATSPALWNAGTTYSAADRVAGTDGQIYISVGGSNLGHDPVLDGTHTYWTATGTLAPWTTSFTQGGGNPQWTQIGGASFPSGVGLTTLDISIYPLGSGPLSQADTRNIFRLPAGFLRRAPSDPKAGSFSILGAPSGLFYDDFVFEGDYFVSQVSQPIVFRFVADVTDVTQMSPMFCEGLAARIAMEVVEPLTQSTVKLQMIEREYDRIMGEARLNNAILAGSEEPAMDDWLAARL